MKWKVFCLLKFNSLVKYIGRSIHYHFAYSGTEIFAPTPNPSVSILTAFYFLLELFDSVGPLKEMNYRINKHIQLKASLFTK